MELTANWLSTATSTSREASCGSRQWSSNSSAYWSLWDEMESWSLLLYLLNFKSHVQIVSIGQNGELISISCTMEKGDIWIPLPEYTSRGQQEAEPPLPPRLTKSWGMKLVGMVFTLSSHWVSVKPCVKLSFSSQPAVIKWYESAQHNRELK